MRRFRLTFLALCLLLLFLGGSDLKTLLQNPAPHQVLIQELKEGEPPGEWLTVTGGMLDLTEAINMSGSIEFDTFLVPLKQDRNDHHPRVMVETRDPLISDLLATYYFKLDSEAAREKFLDENRSRFYQRGDVTGMLAGGLVASGNRDKLMTLTEQLGKKLPDDVLFLSEGKSPARWRGYVFTAIGLIGSVQVLRRGKHKPAV